MEDIFIQTIELDHSPIPDGCLRCLEEVQVKRDGEVWRIYKNDHDPFPSNPHAHNIESGLKLDLSNGELYYKRKNTGKKISKKNLSFIRGKITDIPLPLLSI